MPRFSVKANQDVGLGVPKGMGSAAASAAVRRAPAPNSGPGGRTIRMGVTRQNANGEGAVGSARGGRAPDSKRTMGRAWEFIFLCAVFPIGAHYTCEDKWQQML